MLDDDFLPEKTVKEWTEHDLELAVQELVKESNTNFDSLIKNLENNKGLYQQVYHIAIDGRNVTFNVHDPITNLGVLYGVFVDRNGLAIHNRIYNEVIVNYMTAKMHRQQLNRGAEFGIGYKNADNSLNMKAVLLYSFFINA